MVARAFGLRVPDQLRAQKSAAIPARPMAQRARVLSMKYGYAIIPIPMNIGFQRLKRLPKMNPTKPMLLKNSPAKRFAPEMCGMTDCEAKITPPALPICR